MGLRAAVWHRFRHPGPALSALAVAVALAWVGLRIGMATSLESVLRFGALLVVVAIAGPVLWGRRSRPEPTSVPAPVPQEIGLVLAAMDGLGSVGNAEPGQEVRALVLADRIVLVDLVDRHPDVRLPKVLLSDVTAFRWTASRSLEGPSARVRLHSQSQDPITLQFGGPGRTAELEHFRRTVSGLLPPGVMISELLPVPGWRRRPKLWPLAAVLVLVLPAIGGATWERVRPLPSPAAFPGYYQLVGSGGRPLTLGSPWSRRCVPESVQIPADVPQVVFQQATFAISEFEEASGVKVSMSTAYVPPNSQDQGKDTPVDIQFSVQRKRPIVLLGTAADRLADWRTVQRPGGQASFEWFEGRLDTGLTGADPVKVGNAVRLIMARSVGLMYSDRHGSGIRRHLSDSLDSYSEADQQALRAFSVC